MVKIYPGIVVLALEIGTKMLGVIVKFAKFFKVGKLGLAVGSMASYAYLFTWPFAIMVMISLFVHELGHIIAMKRCGLKTKGIYFIPFIGAAAVTDEMFKSRRDEAYIAIMGPIFGLALCGVALIAYMVTQNALFAAAAGWMAMLNLFNLLPINPLDGGRIMKSITFSTNSKLGYTFLVTGIIILLILTFWAKIILFFVLLIIASLELFSEYKTRNSNEIVKRSVGDIDKVFSTNPPNEIKYAIVSVKNMLLNEKEEPTVRINKIISIGEKFDDPTSDIDYNTRMISHIISPLLRRFDSMPKMTTKGIIIAAIVYIGTSVVLWALITYVSNVPEVDIARKLFMS